MISETTVFDARLDAVPTSPGVYLMKDTSGSVIYVGKAKNLRNRLRSYFCKNPIGNEKVLAMISHIADFECIVVQNELEALLLESNLIKRYQPHYNILLRDDKGYPYVCITMQDEYPRIMKVFRIGPDKDKGARYYGPFLGGDLYYALITLRDIFPTKTCRRVLPKEIGRQRPCLNYHIGRCVAPCKGDVPASEYRAVMEDICRFFEGKYEGIQKDLSEQMQAASERQDYERAVIYRDRLQSLVKIMESQKVSLPTDTDLDAIGVSRDAGEICIRKLEVRGGRVIGSPTFFTADHEEPMEDILTAFIEQHYPNASVIPPEILVHTLPSDCEAISDFLRQYSGHKTILRVPQRGDGVRLLKMASDNATEALMRRILRVGDSEKALAAALANLSVQIGLDRTPERIEAYDISNMGADDQGGGMVVFQNGRPDRASYRLFKIRRVEGQDDYGAMREVLRRRFARAGENDFARMPDLILMDGGQQHVQLAREILREVELEDKVKVAGMVKDSKHRTRGLALSDGSIVELTEDARRSEESLILLRLLTAVQNEVHRFAISYQRKLSKKRHLSFKLESIDGIGPAKRKALLAHFGTIGKVAAASVQELKETALLSDANAEAVYRHFHKENGE
jgi:excinuclease ABC subunit C